MRTVKSSGGGSLVSAVSGPAIMRSLAMAAIRAGSSRTTSAAAVRVSSSVRPCRERSPNSRTTWNASRWLISRQVSASPWDSPASSASTSARPCRSGGTTAGSHCGLDAFAITSAMRSFSEACRPGWLSSTAASSVRSEKEYERLATNPARCAASCTESLNRSVFFGSGSWPPVNSSVIATEARLARPAPRNRVPSSMLAGRAAVPLGGAAAFAVVPQVAEDEDAVGPPPLPRLVGAGVAGRVERADAAAVGFEHQDRRGAALACRARVGLLPAVAAMKARTRRLSETAAR